MEDKVRVFEIAEEAGASSAEVIKKAADLAIILKSPQSAVSFEEAEEIAGYIMTGTSKLLAEKKKKIRIRKVTPKVIVEVPSEVPTKNSSMIKLLHKTDSSRIRIVSKKKDTEKNDILKKNKVIKKKYKANLNIDSLDNIKIKIRGLKTIDELDWELQSKKGVYALIGENGTGKSSLLISIAKLVTPVIFQKEFIGHYYHDTKITHEINGEEVNWVKNTTTDNKWRQSPNDKKNAIYKLRGTFESSILSGTRFNSVDPYIRDTVEYRDGDVINEVDSFIKENMNIILYGNNMPHLHKFNELVYINSERRRKINNKMNTKLYSYYALKVKENYIKEFLFSTGEYFLLSILKFINELIRDTNIEKKSLLIIDEVELSLHPLAQERLVDKLKEFSESYNIVVLFASHSLHVIEKIKSKDVYYLHKDTSGKHIVTNPINKGFLTTKLFKHKFYDYIMVVEDILAEEYLKLTIKEFDNKRLNEKIIKVGTADSVLDIVLANSSQKYYGDAKVIPILDEDKKRELVQTKYARLGGTVIPVKENIEHYFHLMFKNNDGIMKNKLSCFINEYFSPLTLESLNYTYTNQSPKTTYKDIYEKIAFNLPQTGSVTREILSHQVQLDLVKFVYQENKSIETHKTFVRRMKRFLNIESSI